MYDYSYFADLDNHPFAGVVETNFDAMVSDAPFLDKFFNDTPNVAQVKNVTRGKWYHIHEVHAYGDVADFFFMNDNGEQACLAAFFFRG